MVQAWSTFSRKNPNFTQDSISVPIHFYIFQPRYENMPKLWDMLCCNFSEVKYLGTIYNCNAPLFFSFEKWTFGLHRISSRCSMLLLLLLVAHCCTLLPLLQFLKKKSNWKCKKSFFSSFLFFFSLPLSLCDLIVCSFFSFFLVCAAGKQHNILVPRHQKLVYTEVYNNLQSWILAIRQLLNILHIGICMYSKSFLYCVS